MPVGLLVAIGFLSNSGTRNQVASMIFQYNHRSLYYIR